MSREKSLPAFETLTSGYLQLAAQAHAHNLSIVGATLTPFEGALSGTPLDTYYTPEKDALRQRVNDWIRTSGAFDAVVDFDLLLRDPTHPTACCPNSIPATTCIPATRETRPWPTPSTSPHWSKTERHIRCFGSQPERTKTWIIDVSAHRA